MNRKEGVIVGLVLLVSFIGGAFAAPTIQNTFITNDPLNVKIVGGNSLRTTSTDIEVTNFAGVTQYLPFNTGNAFTVGILLGNLTTSFSFAPKAGFQQVSSVIATVLYQAGSVSSSCQACGQPGDMFNFRINGQSVNSIHPGNSNIPSTSVVSLGNLRVGSNSINVSVSNNVDPFAGFYYVYQIRLTVEYTFLG